MPAILTKSTSAAVAIHNIHAVTIAARITSVTVVAVVDRNGILVWTDEVIAVVSWFIATGLRIVAIIAPVSS